MGSITVVFTKRPWNPVSLLIRWMVPRSRLIIAPSSHCLIEDGEYMIEAHMLHGVRRALRDEAMKGLTVVRVVAYSVADPEAGMRWARAQVGQKYDFKALIGIALDRPWMESGSWYCYELAAGALAHAGRDVFREIGNITESMLLSIKP
jgi:uncharacterized protein YycO